MPDFVDYGGVDLLTQNVDRASGSNPETHLHCPVGKYQFPSPLHRYEGTFSTTAFSTHAPLRWTIDVISGPVGVSGNSAKLRTVLGQMM